MKGYRNVLLTTDFTEHEEPVAEKAADLAALYQAELSICHAVNSLPITESVYGPIIPYDGDLTAQLVFAAKRKLLDMGALYGVPEQRQWVVVGSPKTEILGLAEEKATDRIVVGSHGRHGLGVLLGSTATSLLNHARCDVLAVRLTNADV